MKIKEYAILESLPSPVFFKDMEGRFQYCNKAFYEFLGADETEIIGKKADEIEIASVASSFRKADEALLRGEGVQVYEAKVANHKGELRDLQITKDLVCCDEMGGLIGIAGVIVDITERVNFAKKMKELNQIKDIAIQINQRLLNPDEEIDTLGMLLEKSIESIPEARFGAILIINENGLLEMPKSKGYPKEMTKDFKLKPEDSLVCKSKGRIPKEICVVRDIDKMKAVESPELLVLDGDSVKTSLVSPIWLDGEFYGFINIDSTKRNAFDDEDMKIMEYMRGHIQTVLLDMKRYNEKLMLMRTDYVTGIFNRRYFEDLAKKSIEFSKNSGQKACFAIMDIDKMKLINDKYGHVAGDFILKSFAQRIVSSTRGCDIMGRYGGDEFAIIFPGSEKETIFRKMENIRIEMGKKLVEFEGFMIPLEFSYGISEYPAEGNSYCELIKIADDMMYRDKKERKKSQ
ncbi:MAG TPA: diguanylate cyclase [Clostridia bacterium]|nr:diguanylate cyclase [Clostridia bacterium]